MTCRAGTVGSSLSCCLLIGATIVLGGCPDDMREQPSFSSQEAPRLHSPPGSVPVARPMAVPQASEGADPGSRLFSINCSHCHGSAGTGDGPVAGFLPDLPANLHAPAIQKKSDQELYHVITNGEKAMPAFALFLTPEERWTLVSFVRKLTAVPAHAPGHRQARRQDTRPDGAQPLRNRGS
jgi:mono/diheme cytochrome c family protein